MVLFFLFMFSCFSRDSGYSPIQTERGRRIFPNLGPRLRLSSIQTVGVRVLFPGIFFRAGNKISGDAVLDLDIAC